MVETSEITRGTSKAPQSHSYFSITDFKSYLIQCVLKKNMVHLSNSLDEQVGQNTQLVDQDQSPKTLTCPSPSSIYSLF